MRQILNHNGKKGTLLPEEQYNGMKDFIIAAFEKRSEVSLSFLMHKAQEEHFVAPNENSLWQLLKVKQDLEARGIVKIRFVGVAPKVQMLRINRKALTEDYQAR